MRPWGLVALLAGTATASYLARVNVSVAGALMREELALDPVAIGRVFSAFLLGYALCQVPAGMLADRFGAKRVLAAASLSWVVALAAMALVPAAAALPLLLGFRLLLGVGEAPTFPAAAQAISRHIPPEARYPKARYVFLCVSDFNVRARALYERHGYRLVGALPDYVVDGHAELLMAKRLA